MKAIFTVSILWAIGVLPTQAQFKRVWQEGKLHTNDNVYQIANLENRLWIVTKERVLSRAMADSAFTEVSPKTQDGAYVDIQYNAFDRSVWLLHQHFLYNHTLKMSLELNREVIPYVHRGKIRNMTFDNSYVWIAVYGYGVVVIDLKNPTSKKLFFHNQTDWGSTVGTREVFLESDYVNTVFKDHAGRMWIATDKGLWVYEMGALRKVFDQEVSAIMQANDGNCYFAEKNGKVFRSMNAQNLTLVLTAPCSVRTLYEDPMKQNLWVLGTKIGYFNAQTGFTLFDKTTLLAFASTQAFCAGVANNKVYIGTLGSGLYEYAEPTLAPEPITKDTTTILPKATERDTLITAHKPVVSLKDTAEIFMVTDFMSDDDQLSNNNVSLRHLTEALTGIIKSRQVSKIEIVGHASKTAKGNTRKDTESLSKGRSESVRNYLLKTFDFPQNLLNAKHLGDTQLLDSTDPYGPKNRRVEVRVFYRK